MDIEFDKRPALQYHWAKELRLDIKAVIFDYGQVISYPQDPATIDALARIAGVARDKFEPVLWSLRGEYDRGTIGAREYYRDVLSRIGADLDDEGLDEMARVDAVSWTNINAGTVTLMEDVKKAGYVLGILSNMPYDFLDWARANFPVFSLPHVGIFSCELKLIKPEPAIYERMLSMLGLKGGELVFFDDREENVAGAKALGINAFIWESPESARRELKSLGVKL